MKVLQGYLVVTSVMAGFLLFGIVGSLETDAITVRQALVWSMGCFVYITASMIIHKNAPMVREHLLGRKENNSLRFYRKDKR